jgi:hypothetical protein
MQSLRPEVIGETDEGIVLLAAGVIGTDDLVFGICQPEIDPVRA